MFGSLEVRLCFRIGLIEIQLNSHMHDVAATFGQLAPCVHYLRQSMFLIVVKSLSVYSCNSSTPPNTHNPLFRSLTSSTAISSVTSVTTLEGKFSFKYLRGG